MGSPAKSCVPITFGGLSTIFLASDYTFPKVQEAVEFQANFYSVSNCHWKHLLNARPYLADRMILSKHVSHGPSPLLETFLWLSSSLRIKTTVLEMTFVTWAFCSFPFLISYLFSPSSSCSSPTGLLEVLPRFFLHKSSYICKNVLPPSLCFFPNTFCNHST